MGKEIAIAGPSETTTSPPSFPPPNISTTDDVRRWLSAAQPFLAKADPVWIAGRIATLKKHFWIDKAQSKKVTEAIARDWIKALVKFPTWAIEAACVEWMATTDKTPKIFNIAELAASRVIALRRNLRLAESILEPPAEPGIFGGKESPADRDRRGACAELAQEYFSRSAERAAASAKSEGEPVPFFPKPPPASRASARLAKLENPLMFPPESMTAAQRAELAALRLWASGEGQIPEEYDEAEP